MEDGELLWSLKRHGAPLCLNGLPEEGQLDLEETLARSLLLARRSPTVAHVWPVVFAKHRAKLNLPALESMACRLDEGQTLGFFLSLMRALLSDMSLMETENRLQSHKPEGMRYFFELGQGSAYLDLTRMRTPAVAAQWGFWMNTDVEDFASCLHKFVPDHEAVL